MPLVTRDLSTMVEAILDRIVAADVGITDRSNGSVIRTIIEATVQEIALEYYQLQYVYDCIDPDEASGEDLDKLLNILSVIRNPATTCPGVVTFSRSTPATSDIQIPYGTVISTRQDYDGHVVEVMVTDTDKVLLTGQSSIDANVVTVVAGSTYIAPGKLSIMTAPIIGIESVTNNAVISGGSDIETDEELRTRSKLALSGLGKATDSALENAVRNIDGVIDVYVNDMARGVGTSDVSVVCSTMPPQQAMIDLIANAVKESKASGIDVAISYPTVVSVNVTVTLTKDTQYTDTELRNAAGSSIIDYFNSLIIGSPFIVTQMQRKVLESSPGIMDIGTSAPAGNVTATNMQILRVGVITIDGVVWTLG